MDRRPIFRDVDKWKCLLWIFVYKCASMPKLRTAILYPAHLSMSRHHVITIRHQNIVSPPHRICRSHSELGLNIQLPHTLTSLICSNWWLMQQFRYQKYFWPSRKLPVTLRMTALSVRWKICLFGQLSFYLHSAPLVSTRALSVIKYKPSISPHQSITCTQ